ncbi:MAG TPA: phosphatase PAP2 family protein [Gemmatimonadales bacterium]|nr:phosphatase PAP2 family protein [Gemmatimonadales bacterium]
MTGRRSFTEHWLPIDWACACYVGAASIALARDADGVTAWPWLVVAHVLMAGLIFVAPRARAQGGTARFWGEWYPMFLLAGLYGEVGILTVNAGFHNDAIIQRLEVLAFGSEVSYRWIREMPVVWFSWLVHWCYLSFYAMLFASPAGLWVVGKRLAARQTIFAIVVTFFICYVIFLFFPVAGPRYAFALAHNAATEVTPARLARWLLDRGDSWGAAFPSSHVAAAVVATGMAWRHWRKLGLVLAPFTVGLVLAVVYGQFHYALDALSGLMLAGVMLAVMQRQLVPVEAIPPYMGIEGMAAAPESPT